MDFLLESFNSDCGVFLTLLSLPLSVWMEKMKEFGEGIMSLFHSCCNWKDTLQVKKTLSFKATPSNHASTSQLYKITTPPEHQHNHTLTKRDILMQPRSSLPSGAAKTSDHHLEDHLRGSGGFIRECQGSVRG